MKGFTKKIVLILFLLTSLQSIQAQQVRQELRDAAESFRKKDYQKAKAQYEAILKVDKSLPHSHYGLANSQYALGDYDEALKNLTKLAESVQLPPKQAAELMHNIGNCYMKKKDYHKSVSAYKQSLRFNPQDDETRYNLALAMKLAKDQERDSDSDGQSPNPSAKAAEQREVDEVEKPKETRKSDSQDLSREAADKILDAYKEDEQKTREKVERMKQNQSRNKNDKNKKKW